ncbi:hypothetical protein [Pseudomonas fragi]|uniref:hypothetical protein n=1 Tax=Pseudomonas fragi TaxID=296 RepID=UPI000BA1CA71|nr:hypothetical protein [Pseudomonas fragi]PAA16442.1 hypothetical protein CJU74_11775 [Pseudomonas fragi]
MFGFFRKKTSGPSDLAKDTLARTAQILEMNLMLCRSSPSYKSKLSSDFVRGYFLGFLDASLQYSQIQVKNDEDFFECMLYGHEALLKKDIKTPTEYLKSSMHLQNTEGFHKGQSSGGKDYFDFLNGQIKSPTTLLGIFHDL